MVGVKDNSVILNQTGKDHSEERWNYRFTQVIKFVECMLGVVSQISSVMSL
jgi:hypothetical protein